MALDPQRVVCSTITLRHLDLRHALETIARLGFTAVDLGGLPGVCEHVPADLDERAIAEIVATLGASGLSVCSINADSGDLNARSAADDADNARFERLLDLACAVDAEAVVLPNGRQDREPIDDLDTDLDRVAARLTAHAERARSRGIELWVEAPHWFRLAHDLDRAALLYGRLPPEIGAVCDVSHVTASGATPRAFLDRFGTRTRHVHIRDAAPGSIHHSVGRGQVDFPDLIAALDEHRFRGRLALELETRDLDDGERAPEALRAGRYLSDLIAAVPSTPGGDPR